MSSAEHVLETAKTITCIDPDTLPDYQKQMYDALASYNEYAWTRGNFGFRTGFPVMDARMGGLQPGLYLVAAQANCGKSALCAQMARQLSRNNDNLYVIYVSLDDNLRTILPRFIASDQRIPIEVCKFPSRFDLPETQDLLARYQIGFNNILSDITRFKLVDSTTINSVEAVEQMIATHLQQFALNNEPDKKLVIFLDNFHDLDSSEFSFANENQKYEYISGKVKELVNVYDIPVICTAELRKTNGRRPTVDDIRETTKIGYEANLVWLLYNEVGVKDQAAKVYYQASAESTEKRPVIECHWAKNKISSFKGHTYFLFHPEWSYLQEVSAEDQAYFDAKVYS